MGEPAAMTDAERAFVRRVARDVVAGVRGDTSDPLMTLIAESRKPGGVPLDTLVLWLAQEALDGWRDP